MSTVKNKSTLILLIVIMPFMLACLYLERMIQVPEPKMETNADKVIEILNAKGAVALQSLASETYTEAEYAKPGDLKFTANVTNEKPVFFSYGWCAKDQATLQQNFGHIKVVLYFNDAKLGTDVVHDLSYKSTDGQSCAEFGVLMSEWPAGEYHLKAVATFDEKINDGFSDYDPGDYIYEYAVSVSK
jgi:hypothetical protein